MAAAGNGPLAVKIVGASLMGLAGLGLLAGQLSGGGKSHTADAAQQTAFLQLAGMNAVLSQVKADALISLGEHVCSMLGSNGGSQTAVVAQMQADDATGTLTVDTLSALVADAASTLC